MANFTEKAIKATFLELLDKKPLSQITVKDIAAGCGINRNSFYYHFQDIPALIEEIITEEVDRVLKAYPSIDSVEQCLDVMIEFALAHKKAIYHIYHSINRDIFENYLWEVSNYAVTTYLHTLLGDRHISQDYFEALVRYYKCSLFGQVIDWLNNGMRTDVRHSFHLISKLYKDAVLQSLASIMQEQPTNRR